MSGDAPEIVLTALGNEWRGDDAVGWLTLDALRESLAKRGAVVVAESLSSSQVVTPKARLHLRWIRSDAIDLLECWRGQRWVVVIDAALGAGYAGRIHYFNTADVGRSVQPEVSSHGLGLAAALSLAEPLGCRPERLELYLIEGREFAYGHKVSAEVEMAARRLGERLAKQWC